MSRTLATVLAAGSVVTLAGTSLAQTADCTNPAGGSWDTATNWNPVNVPDTGSESARFNLGASYPVSLNSSKTIADLLSRLGVPTWNAWCTALSGKGWWRLAGSPSKTGRPSAAG